MLLTSKGEKKKIWWWYAAVMAVVFIGFVVLTAYMANSKSTALRSLYRQMGMYDNQNDAGAVNGLLTHAQSLFEVTARMVDDMLLNEASSSEIDSLFVTETNYQLQKKEWGFSNFFGVIRGEYFNGRKWAPVAGYAPLRRPWFQEAIKARGNIAISVPHINSRSNESVISVSKRLSDKKSVLALDIYSKYLRNCMRSADAISSWMIIDKNGLVIAHSDVTKQGHNLLSSRPWATDNEENLDNDDERLAREVMLNGKSSDFEYKGKVYKIYSSIVQGKWYVVRIIDENALLDQWKWDTARSIFIALMLYLFIAIIGAFVTRKLIKTASVSRAKSAFLASTSTEINTAVNGILGLNAIIMKEAYGSIKDYAKNIQMAGQGLLSLVNGIMDVSKIETGRMNIEPSEYDVFTVLSESFDALSPRASAKNLHLFLECDPDLPCSLWGDERHIRQIISNLLSNSIKYTEVGEVHLSVGYDSISPKTGEMVDDYVMLKIVVRDTGIGIREDNLDNIFNAFENIDQHSGQNQEGTGLGLSLTKELVERNGGQISVKSRYGEGSTFMVSIPQLVLNVEPIGDFTARYKKAAHKKNEPLEMFYAPNARILIVDDVEINLKVFRGILKNTRIQVDTAVNGVQALKLAQSKRYDIIFLDFMMPVMSGIETFRKLKLIDLNRNTHVIVLVTEAISEARGSYLNAGFTDYLGKPIHEQDLLRMLKWYLPKQLILTAEDLSQSDFDEDENASIPPATPEPASDPFEEIEFVNVTEPSPREKLSLFGEFLNLDTALEFCGNDEKIYQELLQEFTSSDVIQNIKSAFEMSDWDNYRFYVSRMIESSAAVGAEALSQEFQSLKKACINRRHNYILENHERVMELYANIVQKIQTGLATI